MPAGYPLADQIVEQILRDRYGANPRTLAAIARKHKLSYTTVWMICNRATHRHVTIPEGCVLPEHLSETY